MSSALAIASVTQVLRDLLNTGMLDRDVSGTTGENVTVTCLPPDRIDTSASGEQSQLNLFMYMVTPNQGWRNQNMPSLNQQGNGMLTNPYLALDLHYLLSAYSPNELHPEILLGYGMQLLFETPVLPRDAIRNSLTLSTGFSPGTLPANLRSLATSGLADQVEMIKIVPEALNTEEISKLWTAFQANYRPTTAYKVTVVLIQAENSTNVALPVRERKLYVQPFNHPVINSIQSQAAPGQPLSSNQKILTGYRLFLNGDQLKGDIVEADIDGDMIVPDIITPSQVSFILPADLPAGVHTITVDQLKAMGTPPTDRSLFRSNAVAFTLSPFIVDPFGSPVTITNKVDNSDGTVSATLSLSLNPDVLPTQTIMLLLNQYFPGSAGNVAPNNYSFPAQPVEPTSPPGPVAQVQAQVNRVIAGTYLVRVQVDGAESPVYSDATGKFYAPTVVLT
ncbi:Pvc16 family protein [Puia dinghuensis]|uniref:Pvc16 N-terminal domain-containing protein n=1 Tax=Puia dinghuensis TaxID=1792502 RepID=A0A8J2U9K1_9BACT|nr:Pvc16 family protein [Puia dinghuensis]GGA88696.1 hypothetical protein GCM10011511_09910 [Puia dinghuensis]